MITSKNLKTHWDLIYESKPETDFSWFQPYPKTSIEFIQLFNLPDGNDKGEIVMYWEKMKGFITLRY